MQSVQTGLGAESFVQVKRNAGAWDRHSSGLAAGEEAG